MMKKISGRKIYYKQNDRIIVNRFNRQRVFTLFLGWVIVVLRPYKDNFKIIPKSVAQ